MPTHDYIISNGTGSVIRADINNALSAIVSNNSSNSEPATKYAYMWWADTSAGLLKIRNSANDAWITLFELDGTLTLEDGSNSAPALSFRDDSNTGIFSSAADNFDITTGGTTRVNVSSTGINVTGTVIDDGATHDGDVTFTGASANIIFDKSDNALEFADNAKAVFGNSGDLEIFHNASDSVINDAGTGSLKLQLGGATKAEVVSGGFTVTGDVTATTFVGDIDANNGDFDGTLEADAITVGGVALNTVIAGVTVTNATNATSATTATNITAADESSDTTCFPLFVTAATGNLPPKTGSNLAFNSSSGVLTTTGVDAASIDITGANEADVLQLSTGNTAGNTFAGMRGDNEAGIRIRGGGSFRGGEIELAGGLRDSEPAVIKFSTNTGTTFAERMRIDASGNVLIPNDNKKLQIGASQDLEIFHDGSFNYFLSPNAHPLIIESDEVQLRTVNNEKYFKGTLNGAVELYFNNVKRFETTSTGATTTGTLNVVNTGSSTSLRIENGNADFLIQAGDTGSDGLHFFDMDNSAYRVTIANDGNFGIGTTSPAKKLDVNGEIRATGILFGSDTAAANQLDDYEEGTWTPSLEFGGATTGITYGSVQGGSYVKIGRMVTINFGFTLSSKGSASGDATIAGLPFAISSYISGTTVEANGVSAFWNDVATDSANIVFTAIDSSDELGIRHTVGAEDDTDAMDEGDFDNDTAIRGSITYFTAT